jgi:hypothetical protein
MAKRSPLKLPLAFEDALATLLKVPPPTQKGPRTPHAKTTAAKKRGAKKR